MLVRKLTGAVSLVFLLSACAQTELAMHTAKKFTTSGLEKSKGSYKIGKPYKIKGTWYYPAVNYGYVEKGIASWYGPQFHGKKTANGEIFDMNAVSAAHRTLPMPSIVRVTNLKNGRSLKMKVNDRGPFAKGRIIDLSRRAAQLLGFERSGTALVRVEIDADESRRIAAIAQGKATANLPAPPPQKVVIASLPGSDTKIVSKPPAKPKIKAIDLKGTRPLAIVKQGPVQGGKQIYVQAGAFLYRDLATKMQKLLDPVGPTRVVEAVVGKHRYYRVQVGPAKTVGEGDRLLELVIASGYPKARLVVE